MKEEILDIAKKLYHNHLTPELATNLLLRLFDVSRCNSDKLVECSNCGDNVEMISSGEFCPHCFC
jgi:hypothetical protein